MDRKIAYLARCRQVEAEYKVEIAEAEAELRGSRQWDYLVRQRELLATAKADVKDAEADVREAVLLVFPLDVKPHPAVKVKMYTVLEYDADEAHAYARQNFPHALKLDKRAFEKVAKVTEPDFVTITKEPRVTIARDLSEWLAEEMES